MSLGVYVRSLGGLALSLAVALPFVLHGGCGSNATDPGAMGGAGGMTDPDAGAGGSSGGSGGGGGDEPEVPVSVCPKEPIKTLAGLGVEGSASQPSLAWTGHGDGGFVVVWGADRGAAIHAALVDSKGSRMAGGADIVIADTAGAVGSPEIAPLPNPADGFIVAFEDCDPATVSLRTPTCAVATVVVGPDGQPKGAPVTISPAAMVQRRPYLATGHGKVYVAYRELAAGMPVARVAILDATGAQSGPGVLVDMTSGQFPHVAVNDSAAAPRVAVVYQREKTVTEDIVLAIYDADLMNPTEVAIRTGIAGEASNPVVQWNTEAWVVAWEDNRGDEAQIYAAVVNGATMTVGAHAEAYDENGNWPTIATGGRNTSLIGFYGYPGQRVFLSRIHSRDGLRMGQVVLDTGKFPAVAYNPKSPNDEYAVVYENNMAKNVMFATFTCASAM